MTYHHGNLKEALITEAINLLETEGVPALSLRRVAREAGVSQAAPYSHFKNKKALMTAVAEEGYRRFKKSMESHSGSSEHYMVGLGIGYVLFALANPALFHLMFAGELAEMIEADRTSEPFSSSYLLLVDGLKNHPLARFDNEGRNLDTAMMWSMVHGIANLILEGKISAEEYGHKSDTEFVEAILNRCVVK